MQSICELGICQAFFHRASWIRKQGKTNQHVKRLRFNRVATLALIIFTWLVWAFLLALLGIAFGPGIGSIFLAAIFAAVGLSMQVIATFCRADIMIVPLSAATTMLATLVTAVIFEGDETFEEIVTAFILFILPVAGVMALVKWMCFADKAEQPKS